MADALNFLRIHWQVEVFKAIVSVLLFWPHFPNVMFTDGKIWRDQCKVKSSYSFCSWNIYKESNPRVCRKTELLDFEDWDFVDESPLKQVFPLDKEARNYERQVYGAIFSTVRPVPLKFKPHLVAVSTDALTDILDMKSSVAESGDFAEFVAGNKILPNSVLLSHRYGGHQFGQWAGQLGDGRAVMLGEFVNRKRERWELQLKGSGRTPYSRRGDGRAVLRSSVREFLASEAMFYLGIPTSRAASLTVSNDRVLRDQFYDGHPTQERAAVVLRLAKSWFRIGSLEILTSNGEKSLLRKVVDFVIENHYPDVAAKPRKYLEFFSKVVTMTADMIARWQSVGFAHGVCNTDNFSLLSITIDYGPFGFMDKYNPDFVPNTSDEEGRYSFKNQPNVGFFNMEKLLRALRPLLQSRDYDDAEKVLLSYVDAFNKRFLEIFRQKLGLLGDEKQDEMLIKALLWMMAVTHSDFTMTFRGLSDMTLEDITLKRVPAGSWALKTLEAHDNWEDWLERYAERIAMIGLSDTDAARMKRMRGVNPHYILRNWMAQSAIEKADRDDFSEVRQLLEVLKRPFTKQEAAENLGYSSKPPYWAARLRVSCSS